MDYDPRNDPGACEQLDTTGIYSVTEYWICYRVVYSHAWSAFNREDIAI